MLDIKLIREQTAVVKAELARAGVDEVEIDRIIEADARRRHLQHELDEMRALRTRESRELGRMEPAERDARRAEMRELGDRIAAGERELAEIERKFADLMLGIRNIPRPDVPNGSGETDNRVVRSVGEPRKFDFTPLPHWELGERLGIIERPAAPRASRTERSRALSQARTRRRLWPTAVRMTFAASPSRSLKWQRPRWPSVFMCPITGLIAERRRSSRSMAPQRSESHRRSR